MLHQKYNDESKRAKEFYQLVASFFNNFFDEAHNLVEFCAGNGNGGRIFAEEGKIRKVVFVDIKKVRDLEITLANIDSQAEFYLEKLEDYVLNQKDNAVIAIHACGSLTDLVLEKAVKSRIPVAVMPCCYNPKMKHYKLRNPPDPRLLLYPRIEDYYDLVRLQYLTENGYQAVLRKINPRITPMNNVLIGIPK